MAIVKKEERILNDDEVKAVETVSGWRKTTEIQQKLNESNN